MARGLPKSIIKKYGVTKKAWRIYRAGKGKKRTRSTRRSSNPKRSVRKTARRYARKIRRRSAGMTIPLAPIAGLAGGLVACGAVEGIMKGDIEYTLKGLCAGYTGYDPDAMNFDIGRLAKGVLPLAVGCLVHKFIGGPPLNLNKVLARAKIPFIRI